MNNSIKILLTIHLEGGALVRQSKPSFITWSQTERDLNPEREWKEGEGYNVVNKGITKHYPLESRGALQKIKITKDAYDAMISDECPSGVKKGDWFRLNDVGRLEVHLLMYSKDLGGNSFSYDILKDE